VPFSRHYFLIYIDVMERQRVVSSVLESIGYSPETLMLEITFIGKKEIYQYHGVTTDLYEKLMAASSHGKFFNSNIKDNFPFSRSEEKRVN
jgi:hypothetical protein